MSEMTISQALRRLKAVRGELKEELERAQTSVSFKKGEEPAFTFSICMEKADKARIELIALETRISLTNAVTMVSFNGNKIPLSSAVKRLQEIKGQLKWFEELKPFVKNQTTTTLKERDYEDTVSRFAYRDIEWTCHLPEAKRAEKVSELKSFFDSLNDVVETANHRTLILPIPEK